MSKLEYRIQVDPLTGDDVIGLVNEHFNNMRSISPEESCHVFDVDSLKGNDMTFWSVWSEDALAGCGAMKELSSDHGEIKSMRTHESFKRQGVGKAMLEHIIGEARARGYGKLSLETGSFEPFIPARNLYKAYGFTECPPFGDYVDDENSIFMELIL